MLRDVAYMNADSNDYCGIFFLLEKDESFRSLGRLRLFKSGDEEATTPIEVETFNLKCFVDFIQFKRKFYAIDFSGKTVCIEPFVGASFLVSKVSRVIGEFKYLVESRGNLLLVERTGIRNTLKFEVFLLDGEGKKWDRLESLGNMILFLGKHCNFAAPAIPRVEGNCIVFTSPTDVIAATGENEGEKTFFFHLRSRITLPWHHRRHQDLYSLFYTDSLYS